MNPTTSDLAQAHISELRRQACAFRTGCVQRFVREHRRRSWRPAIHWPALGSFLPFEAGLFRHP